MSSVLEVRKVTKTTRRGGTEKHILRDVSFDLNRGEFLCIMGPSGSGKTTLLHLLAGLEKISAGEVILEGEAFSRATAAELTRWRRDRIAQVFQFFNLMPNLTLKENVALPLAIAGRPLDDDDLLVERLLRRFNLMERAHALPHELSGGEMQRTSLARALCGGQPLLFCDEPTGNLSQQAGLEVMEILRRLASDDNKSIVLVTHNPRDAAFADRVLFLVDGRLAEDSELKGPDLHVDDIHRTLASLKI